MKKFAALSALSLALLLPAVPALAAPVPDASTAQSLRDAVRTDRKSVVLKSLAAWFVMLAPSRQAVREGERAVVHGLVEAFTADPEGRMDRVHVDDYLAAADDAARRRAVVDQVASLSDLVRSSLRLRPVRFSSIIRCSGDS